MQSSLFLLTLMIPYVFMPEPIHGMSMDMVFSRAQTGEKHGLARTLAVSQEMKSLLWP